MKATITSPKHLSANVSKSGSGSSLPFVTEEDNGKILTVVDGKWEAAELQIPEQYGLVTYNQDKTISVT